MPILPNTLIKIPDPGVTVNWGSNTTYGTDDAGLNYSFTQIDNIFAAAGSGTSIGLNVGSGKTMSVSGTLKVTGTALLGADGATGVVAGNTIRAGNASGSDTAGGNLTIAGGNSTGTAAGGSILMQVAAAGASSGSSANTLRNVLRVESTNRVGINTGSTAPSYVLDVGAGGSGTSNAQQSIRINGSDAGAGTNGGSLIRVANNGTDTGALGNYSSIVGNSEPFNAATTLASASTLRFFTGTTIAGAVASDEKLRIGTAGEIGIWDAALDTPGINNGSAGQVLVSGGDAAAPSWRSTLDYLSYQAAVPVATTYVIDSTVITSPFKRFELIYNDLGQTSGNSRRLQIQISGDNGANYTTAQTMSANVDGGNVSGYLTINNAALDAGTRLLQGMSSVESENTVYNLVNPTASVTGSINAIKLLWNGSGSFRTGGTVTLIGYN